MKQKSLTFKQTSRLILQQNLKHKPLHLVILQIFSSSKKFKNSRIHRLCMTSLPQNSTGTLLGTISSVIQVFCSFTS
jgi:hypothetical protein